MAWPKAPLRRLEVCCFLAERVAEDVRPCASARASLQSLSRIPGNSATAACHPSSQSAPESTGRDPPSTQYSQQDTRPVARREPRSSLHASSLILGSPLHRHARCPPCRLDEAGVRQGEVGVDARSPDQDSLSASVRADAPGGRRGHRDGPGPDGVERPGEGGARAAAGEGGDSPARSFPASSSINPVSESTGPSTLNSWLATARSRRDT